MIRPTFWEVAGLLLELYSSDLPPDIWAVMKASFVSWLNHLPEYLWLITHLPFG